MAAGLCCFSVGLGSDATDVGSVEKALGLKSNGDRERKRPLAGNDGGCCDRKPESPLLTACGVLGIGETEDARFIGSSLTELGDTSSGLAIRKPPRDFDRLKSPSIEKEEGPRRPSFFLFVKPGSRTYRCVMR